MFTSPLLWSRSAKNVTLIPVRCETGIQESPPSPTDFQLHMHTPQCLPLFHFPVCWLEDMIVNQENSVGEGGGYSVFMHMHVCVQATALWTHTYTKLRNRQRFISDSCNVNKVGMVERKRVGWRQGMGENGPRPWEVSAQAADNVDVAQELTGRDLMGKNQAS